MNKSRIGITLFHALAVIIPATLVLHQLCLAFIRWSASYSLNGMTYQPRGLIGFPLPIAGEFIELNGGCVRCITINWTNYYLNWLIVFTVTLLIWFFVRRKITFSTWTGCFTVSVIAVVVYVVVGYMLMVLLNVVFDYRIGMWPDSPELNGLTTPF